MFHEKKLLNELVLMEFVKIKTLFFTNEFIIDSK